MHPSQFPNSNVNQQLPARSIRSPPPLSKYNQTPPQGWAPVGPPQRHSASGLQADNTLQTPPLPPRPSPSLSQSPQAYTAQPTNDVPGREPSWHLPRPASFAPPADRFATSLYNPSTYGPMPNSRLPPASSQLDSSRREGKHNQASSPERTSKPPLPPRLPQNGGSGPSHYQLPPITQQPSLEDSMDRHVSSTLQFASNKASPTTAYNYGNSWRDESLQSSSQSDQTQQLPPPPPPPPPLPQGYKDELLRNKQGSSQQPLTYPTQPQAHRYNAGTSAEDLSHFERRKGEPPISKFNGKTPPLMETYESHGVKPQSHQSSISPVGADEDDQWITVAIQGKPRPVYVSPPASTHAIPILDKSQHSIAAVHVPEAKSSNPAEHPSREPLPIQPHGSKPAAQDGVSSDHSMDNVSRIQKQPDQRVPESSAAAENKSLDAKSNLNNAGRSLSILDAYEVPIVLHNASSLGFGGPSDWEYFGDYETEEIDDTDLYGISKSQAASVAVMEAAELASRSSPPLHIQDLPSAAQNDQKVKETTLIPRESPAEVSLEGENENPETSIRAADESQLLQESSTAKIGTNNTAEQAHMVNNLQPSDAAVSNERMTAPESSKNYVLDVHCSTEGTIAPDTNKVTAQSTIQQTTSLPTESSSHGSHLKKPSLSSSDPENIDLGMANKDNTSVDQSLKIDSQEGRKQNFEVQDSSAVSPGMEETSQALKIEDKIDLYSDLDAWGKASLARYVAMLREEAQAKDDHEKFKIFMAFTGRESRLRAVLYGADMESSSNAGAKVMRSPSTMRHSMALPFVGEIAPLRIKQESPARLPILPHLETAKQSISMSDREFSEELKPEDDSPDGVQYSPGGRPTAMQSTISKAPLEGQSSHTPSIERPSQNSDAVTTSTVLDPNHEKQKDSPTLGSFPASVHSGVQEYVVTRTPAPERLAYTPFRYSEGLSKGSSTAIRRQPSYRPYSALKGKFDPAGNEPNKWSESTGKETARAQSTIAMENSQHSSSKPENDETPTTLFSTGISDQGQITSTTKASAKSDSSISSSMLLNEVLPRHSVAEVNNPALAGISRVFNGIPDDFSFIHKTVVAWDGEAKKVRDLHEKERHIRQIETEQKIDGLFNDQEIGYGDIADLEAEFKQSEATRKANEDRWEYQTFVRDVFDSVWMRLHFEIDQLTPPYQNSITLLNDALVGKEMFTDTDHRPILSSAMVVSLSLHQKLEIRHQKAFEAVLERDRRLKRTEVGPLYARGDVSQVKKLEKQFEHAERSAILAHCRNRDERANKLMDELDQNTIRGVEANQNYMETIMQAVRRSSGAANANEDIKPTNTNKRLEEALKAKSVAGALALSSEQIVRTYHVADMLLNAADYEVSVAQAKLSNADTGTFKRLSEEKGREDQKLVNDLEHRLGLIRKDSRRTNDEIARTLSLVESSDCPNDVTLIAGSAPAAGHEERIQIALEEAKIRNAVKSSGVNVT